MLLDWDVDIVWGVQTSEIQKSFGVQQLEFIGISRILIVLQILALCVQIFFPWKKQIFMVLWTVLLFVFGENKPNTNVFLGTYCFNE